MSRPEERLEAIEQLQSLMIPAETAQNMANLSYSIKARWNRELTEDPEKFALLSLIFGRLSRELSVYGQTGVVSKRELTRLFESSDAELEREVRNLENILERERNAERRRRIEYERRRQEEEEKQIQREQMNASTLYIFLKIGKQDHLLISRHLYAKYTIVDSVLIL